MRNGQARFFFKKAMNKYGNRKGRSATECYIRIKSEGLGYVKKFLRLSSLLIRDGKFVGDSEWKIATRKQVNELCLSMGSQDEKRLARFGFHRKTR